MKMHHRPSYWIAVALAVAALLFTLSDAHGQSTGAAAVFEGRPAMSGAQGGLGAQAGPPQGGIGLQGNERAPSGSNDTTSKMGNSPSTAPQFAEKDLKPGRDQSLAKDERSVKKAKRATKRTIKRARHGVSEIDSTAR